MENITVSSCTKTVLLYFEHWDVTHTKRVFSIIWWKNVQLVIRPMPLFLLHILIIELSAVILKRKIYCSKYNVKNYFRKTHVASCYWIPWWLWIWSQIVNKVYSEQIVNKDSKSSNRNSQQQGALAISSTSHMYMFTIVCSTLL